MTSNEMKAARKSVSRGSSIERSYGSGKNGSSDSYDKTNKEIQHISAQIQKLCNGQAAESFNEAPRSPPKKNEPKIMVKVNVTTRGTSPTKPSSDIPRTRTRTETVAKTIEKTISRPLNRPEMADKEIQSDRMDDTTRSSRYAFSSPRSASSYSSSYSPVSYPSSRMTGVRSVRDVSSSPVTSSSSPSSNRTTSSSKTPKSPESKSSSKSSGSPTTNGCLKWTNKDFRKSALNMGNTPPTTTPSTPTSSSDATKQVQMLFQEPQNATQQRESSTESETCSSSSLSESPSSQEQRAAQTSVSIDEMPTTYVNDQSQPKTDQPKSFLAKNFSPVKIKIQNKSNSSLDQHWLDDTTVSDSLDTERIWSPDTNISFNLDSRMTPVCEKSKENSREGSVKPGFKIKSIQSGERAWWLGSDSDKSGKTSRNSLRWTEEENEQVTEEIERVLERANQNEELGDRASPEGVEDRKSPYDNVPLVTTVTIKLPSKTVTPVKSEPEKPKFISRYSNIDDILGGTTSLCNAFSPISDRIFAFEECQEISPDQVKIHDSSAQIPIIKPVLGESTDEPYEAPPKKLDDASLQVYKDGDYGSYLDLESSLAEQLDEIEGLNESRKNSLVVRTQLSVRVHVIIEKLNKSEGRELRKALFTLKQIFQEDKDLVHGFVALGGLNCLVKIGRNADQNHQNYILRALGQVMLYVDGMDGVMKHKLTIEWLYSLIGSKYRLVVKTALKLLLVFVEYSENNCYTFVDAIRAVDASRGLIPWSNIMKLLKDYENADTELLIYATSLINKTLSGLSDQDVFYDESDFLEQQGMEGIIQRYMSRPGTDLDLLDQLQLYELVLRLEDGDVTNDQVPDNTVRKTPRYRTVNTDIERKSRRHSSGYIPAAIPSPPINGHYDPFDEDSSSSGAGEMSKSLLEARNSDNGESAGTTPYLRKRRDRAERQKSLLKEQLEMAAANKLNEDRIDEQNTHLDGDQQVLSQLKRDQTVKDLTQKLSNLPLSPTMVNPDAKSPVGDMTGLISKAKEGLSKSKSKNDLMKSPSANECIKPEPKKSETDIQWEELVNNFDRELKLCDLDFTDLQEDDDVSEAQANLSMKIPPPPPIFGMAPMAPMMNGMGMPPGPPKMMMPPPMMMMNGNANDKGAGNTDTIKKNRKTVKLFWKEVRDDLMPRNGGPTIWDELPVSEIDTEKLEFLFESRAKDLQSKKQQEMNKNKEIIVLDHKRSNAINIAITKLPPSRAIKTAIMKMDSTVVTREGIDKLLNMLPTEEERGKIQEAQLANPDLPLGSAEQFLLTLSSISELSPRLKLWAFKLDFENIEKEIAEPLMDLKQGIELLRKNATFKAILSTLRSIGIFLNGAPVKGFQIDYLAKVPEVKDTVQKHSLLHHLCHMVMEATPSTTDLYSEIGPITRASKTDFGELAHNIIYLETECKASWDRLSLISKHAETAQQLKQKLFDFLTDAAERIIILDIIHRRVLNRYRKFLTWLSIPQHRINEMRPNEFCRIISEFALEYRTTRERVQQQLEKKLNHRERNKTRGKLIIDIEKAKALTNEDKADAELRQILGTPKADTPEVMNGNFTWRRRKAGSIHLDSGIPISKAMQDNDDELIETLVKTATKPATPRQVPRERKRSRNADRKSLRRTLKNGLFDGEESKAAVFFSSNGIVTNTTI
ncbi:FH1/FH2 domain-containing protein 3 isoform X3 [Culicoides brevitarsis]|uniref:FH1/FH2 domain-containing protein 3 isoform X3 n=1 Tax=Culicoides brevitarsis TaxID=469753 RepID=UPI00307BFE0D